MAKKPSPMEADRKKISVPVQHQLLMEAGYKCGNPACRNIITLELHHIEYVSEGGGNDPSNLLVLCPYCHSMHHAGHIPVDAVRFWKGLLAAMNQAFDRQSMDLLLFMYQNTTTHLWFSADGVLRFAGLIAAGMVSIVCTEMSYVAGTDMQRQRFTQTTHKLGLSLRGRLLVEAWLAGDEAKYRTLVSGPPIA